MDNKSSYPVEQNGTAVHQANRSDLFRMLPFLEKRLPICCEIHLLVLSTLLTSNPSYHIYFLRNHSSDDDYSAIVGVKGERSNNNGRVQKIWIMGGWSVNENELLRVYDSIDRINWSQDIVMAYNATYEPHPEILEFFNDLQRVRMPFPLIDRYVIDIPDALEMEVNLPEDVYVKSLEHYHARAVFQSWPYNHLTTLQDVTDEIIQLPSAGLFLKANDELVTWIMCHPPNGMSRLHTMEQHRRKGYGSLVTKYLTKRMAQAGYYPYVNIVAGNAISATFFENLGFRFLSAGHVWLTSPS